MKMKDDPWIEEKIKIEKFYKEYFDRSIDWSLVSLPAKSDIFKKIEYIFADITEDQVVKAYTKKFGMFKISLEWNSITNVIESQQDRPTIDYVFAHVGGIEVDMPNYLYSDGILQGVKFMTPKEGLISAFRERAETGNMYDIIGLTRFAALDYGRCIISMCRRTGDILRIGSYLEEIRNPLFGIRQVSF